MSWGTITAGSNKPADLEKALNEAAQAYFDSIDLPEEADKGGRAQAAAAAHSAKALMTKFDAKGSVNVTMSGHFGDHNVPSGITISIVDLEPPAPPEPVIEEPDVTVSTGNGQN